MLKLNVLDVKISRLQNEILEEYISSRLKVAENRIRINLDLVGFG